MIAAFVSLGVLGFLFGGGLSLAAFLMRVESDPLADELEEMLPGLQCGQCGFPGCRGAAEALSGGDAEISLCPPGGSALIEALADKLHLPADILEFVIKQPEIAFIEEDGCIGCTKCIQVCTTDSIVGAPKLMHTVIPGACAGGGKCVVVCPTECIIMVPEPAEPVTLTNWYWPKPRRNAA